MTTLTEKIFSAARVSDFRVSVSNILLVSIRFSRPGIPVHSLVFGLFGKDKTLLDLSDYQFFSHFQLLSVFNGTRFTVIQFLLFSIFKTAFPVFSF
jgi:hypothetical protein